MTIGTLSKADAKMRTDINNLLSQIRSAGESHVTTMAELNAIVADKNIVVVIAKDGTRIVGMATLYLLQKFGKRIGRVEDVVVDSAYRGRGLGRTMMEKIIAIARARKIQALRVDSRPVHSVANKLYHSLGFSIKKTNPYRMEL